MNSTQTLYRPVGLAEANLILDTDGKAFPPRLPHQPFFYPVVTIEYARQIARDWNTKDAASGFAGFVTRFEVDARYLRRFEVRQVGASTHKELWIPSEQLDDFNAHIDGQIQFIEAYYGEGYEGIRTRTGNFDARRFLYNLYFSLVQGAAMEFNGDIATNRNAVLLNLPYWQQTEHPDILPDEKGATVNAIRDLWLMKFEALVPVARELLHF